MNIVGRSSAWGAACVGGLGGAWLCINTLQSGYWSVRANPFEEGVREGVLWSLLPLTLVMAMLGASLGATFGLIRLFARWFAKRFEALDADESGLPPTPNKPPA